MKLRNRKTGEIGNLLPYGAGDGRIWVWIGNTSRPEYRYNSLAELNEEWEDVPQGPKVGYIIDPMEEDCVSADDSGYEESDVDRAKELGIWLETEEEAKKAVERLKAFKRLKDKGFRFTYWGKRSDWAGLPEVEALKYLVDIVGVLPDNIDEFRDDLDLLFSGEDD